MYLYYHTYRDHTLRTHSKVDLLQQLAEDGVAASAAAAHGPAPIGEAEHAGFLSRM